MKDIIRDRLDTLIDGDLVDLDRLSAQIVDDLTPPDPWSTDLQAAPLEKEVLVWCDDAQRHYVAYRLDDKVRGLFCYAIHRGAYLMCKPTKWREIPT